MSFVPDWPNWLLVVAGFSAPVLIYIALLCLFAVLHGPDEDTRG